MKKRLLLFVFALVAIVPSIFSYDFELDGIYYNFYGWNDQTLLSVTFKNLFSESYSGFVVIPSSVKYKGVEYNVGEIGFFAFRGCKNLTYVVLPEGLKCVGQEAFELSSLPTVVIPSSVDSIAFGAFGHCANLTSATLADGIKVIEDNAFTYCTSLTSINLPKTLTRIGSSTFSGCSSLTSIVIPESVTSIGRFAFHNCKKIDSVIIPKNVNEIGMGVLGQCNLSSIKVEEGNPNYDSRDACNAIIETSTNTIHTMCKNTIIPNSVSAIGAYAFSFVGISQEVIIPNTITFIGDLSFCGSEVESVIIPESVVSIGDDAFQGCEKLVSITIPNSVVTIGASAFAYCKNLKSINLPNNLRKIENSLFDQCRSLEGITIPNSVSVIGQSAFNTCDRLMSVTIGGGVTSIEDAAFVRCPLWTVFCYAVTPPQITNNTFSSYNTLHVLQGMKEAYMSADYWNSFEIIDDLEPIKATSIEMGKEAYYVKVGGVGQATCFVYPENATSRSVEWSCSDPFSVYIDGKTGQFVGIKLGEVTITATTLDGSGLSATSTIYVTEDGKDPNFTSVQNVDIVCQRFFDITGKEIPYPRRGLTVVVKEYEGGRVETEKRIIY